MTVRLEPAWSCSVPQLAEVLTRAYSGYFVPIRFTASGLATTVRVHSIDLDTSQVVYQDDVAIGAVLLAHRGCTTRVAAMGIVPEFRHAGVGQRVLGQILNARRQRGDRRFTLEVIEANAPAIRVYEKAGFRFHRYLVGHQCGDPQGEPSAAVEEVDIEEAARILIQVGPPDLPWQVSGEALAQLGPPACGFRLHDAFAVIEPREHEVELLSLVVLPPARRQGRATRLLKALFAKYPATPWKIPPRFPAGPSAGLLMRLGFVPLEIRQWQMVLSLG
jgi:GNAT superfamily N-acetyltransferase